jgi:transposase
MMTPELEATILRLHHAERWPPGTIATQLGLHHAAVRRVLERDGAPRASLLRPSKVDAYVPFILETLKKYPRLSAVRLYQMIRERGYEGQPDSFRAIVRRYRPAPPREAFLRLRTLPSDQAQVDWGHFGTIRVGEAKRPLVGFVMVLSYSRAIFLRFFPSQNLAHFLAGHEEAFARWSGVPRTILYDNLKSVVLDRIGDAIRFNPQLLAFAGHYRYEPRPVAPYRGNEKGRVERAIRYVRDNFLPARSFETFADANHQADAWCATIACERGWPEDPRETVADALERDRAALRPLPDDAFPCHERVEVRVGKTPYVRFDLNDYSIPYMSRKRTLVVLADLLTVRVLDGDVEIARHERSFDRGRQIEDPPHIEELKERKRHARKARAADVLSRAVPSSAQLLARLAERHQALGRHAAELLDLLRTYGATRLETAIAEALAKNAPHPQAVRHILEREHEARGATPALPLPLRPNPRLENLDFTPHSLGDYDTRADDDETLEDDKREEER